jgi:metallophosphoesterase superfamily enzyme
VWREGGGWKEVRGWREGAKTGVSCSETNRPSRTGHRIAQEMAPALRICLLSDLHIEFNFTRGFALSVNDAITPGVHADVLVLNGDIGTVDTEKDRETLRGFLTGCSGRFEHVLLVPGNHEYYAPSSRMTMEEVGAEADIHCRPCAHA